MGNCSKKVGALVLLLLFCNLGSLPGVDSQTVWHIFDRSDMNGLQSLWAAWNTSTPHPRSNLLNWFTPAGGETPWPCYDGDKNWRGITCLRYQLNATQWDTSVVGLQLSDASIAGTLPPGISHFHTLVTLSLTGNPNLTGNLPKELAKPPLNILDLHDNGFNGTIPAELKKLWFLLELDLSGNQFVGEFPIQFSTTPLQVFKIARNLLRGEIPENAFENMTKLLILDLSGNSFTGPSPKFPVVDSALYNLNISNNKFTGLPELSQIFNGWLPKSLGVLDLSGLNIGGRLPVDWHLSPGLLSLEKLYLNNINISGVLDIKNMQSSILNLTRTNSSSRTLQVLSLMNNDITDVVFDKQFLKDGQIKLFLQGNPYCAAESKDADGRRCFCEQFCAISPEPSKKSYLKVILITTSICAVLLGSVIFFLFVLLQRKNQHVHTLLKRFDESDVRAKRFEYSEIRTATKNFAEERKLGQGAYGAVYKGILPNNVPVAVKRLFMKTQEASEDFLNEVLLITNLQHRNLVALKGYCLHGKEMLLVYEFVDNCDLEKLLLQGSSVWQEVAWPARMHICLGIAQGLYYLHASSSSQTKIIHRDIKASNILVDNNLNPKIADFGLARPIQDEKSGIMTMQRAGTIGYAAPEYMLYGQLSDKADVYSFGVLLLEIVSGNRNKDLTQPDDEVYLPYRAVKLHKEDRLIELLDSRLHVTEADALEVQRVLEVAVMCVQGTPDKRPTMFRVVAMLAGDANVVIAPIDDIDVSPMYNFTHYESTTENPFRSSTLTASSSANGSSSSPGRFTNGNATMELQGRHSAR